MSKRRYAVRWGTYTVLQAEFDCMETMWDKPSWKYFINLTGQELPLKTVLDIVQILKTYKGANAIGFDQKNYKLFRKRVLYRYVNPYRAGEVKGPPPNNIKITFGGVHVALTRSFVDYILHNQYAEDFKDWVKDTKIPDETFFSSLNVNPDLGVPGAFTGDPTVAFEANNPLMRYKRWYKCKLRGIKVRDVCILGVHDLPELYRAPELFANKFLSEYQPVGRMCLEEFIMNKTRAQIKGNWKLNLEPYKKPLFVLNHTPS